MSDNDTTTPLVEKLENALESDPCPDDDRGKVFFAIGVLKYETDPETEEALEELAELMKEV